MDIKENLKAFLPQELRGLPRGCYLTGGCVRDLLRGETSGDYDVAVAGDALAAVTRYAEQNGRKILDLSNDRFKLWRLAGRGLQIDFTPLNGDCLANDLARRDFTINAMAYEPHSGEFTDLNGGLRDLAAKRIAVVGPAAFVNDPVRLLRAFRFAATLNFNIDRATMALINEHAYLAAEPAAERILAELTKLLAAPNASGHIRQMARCGVLFALFPELEVMEEHKANNFTDISALEHTFRVVEELEGLLLNPAKMFTPDILAAQGFAELNEPQAWFRLKLAALLHDVGKPATKTTGADNRVHYYGHEDLGAQTAVEICRRLRCSNRDSLLVFSMIGAHMKALTMFNNHRKSKRPQHKRALFYLDYQALLPGLFYIFLADALSKRDTLKPGYLDFIVELVTVYVNEFLPRNQRPLPLNGHDLRELFNPRPIMLTFMLRELAVENAVRETFTREFAIKAARDTYYMLKSREPKK